MSVTGKKQQELVGFIKKYWHRKFNHSSRRFSGRSLKIGAHPARTLVGCWFNNMSAKRIITLFYPAVLKCPSNLIKHSSTTTAFVLNQGQACIKRQLDRLRSESQKGKNPVEATQPL